MQYLYGKIIYLPRKFYDTKGKKRLGKVLLLEGDRSGEIVNFDIEVPPPSVAISRNSIVRMYCTWRDENTIVIPDITGIMPRLSSSAVAALMKHSLPDINPEALIEACEVNKLDAVFDLFKENKEKFIEMASARLTADQVEAVTNFFVACLREHDYDMLCNMLTEAEPGIDMHDVLVIYDLFEHRGRKRKMTVTQMVRKEPWIIAQAEGISFKQADKVAAFFGFEGFPVGKVAGAIMKVLWDETRNGNVYVPKGTVINRAKGILRNKYTNDDDVYKMIKTILSDENLHDHFRGMWIQDLAFANDEIVTDLKKYYKRAGNDISKMKLDHKGRGIYLCGPFRGELYGAERFAEFVQSEIDIKINENEFLKKALNKYPKLNSDRDQKKAVLSVARNKITLLTGSAGSGKTEVIAAVVNAMMDYTPNIRLMAPTGIAAQRLAERAGINASTIHVGVKIFKEMMDYADPVEENEIRNNDDDMADTLPSLTVVDEFGMCDVMVFNKLLREIPPDGRLLLVGDPAQLSAPGPGNVINDLVRLAGNKHKPDGFNHVELRTDHRGSVVTENANRIRRGEDPIFGPAFKMIPATNNNQIELLDELLDELIASGVPFGDILVLSSRKGEAIGTFGVETLNRHLQKRFNPSGKEIKGTSFRIGDPVICIENDYQKNYHRFARTESRRDVFNGEKGVIVSFDDEDVITVDLKDGSYAYTIAEAARWLRLGYALTIHKSQSGESPVVIIVDWDSKRFTRSMMYTAVTRAKYDKDKPYSEHVYFIGYEGFVSAAIKNIDAPRYTKFYYRVLDNLGIYVSGNKEERRRRKGIIKMVSEDIPPEDEPGMAAKPPDEDL